MPACTYLDHAATTPMRSEVLAAMTPFLTDVHGNPSGMHAVARAAKRALEEARERVASIVGAEPGGVVFTSGGTEADNLALKGAARAARASDPTLDGVVVSAFEHKAVLRAAERLEADGFRVAHAPVTRDGLVDADALRDFVDDRTAVVSVMTVNNEVGTVQPVHEIARVVRAHAPRAAVHTDAVQAASWLDVARATADADLVTLSAHKLGGPKGAGALVMRGRARVVPEIDGGGQERGLRSGTVDVAAAVGFATALALAQRDVDVQAHRVALLRDRLLHGLLAACPGSWCNGTRDATARVAGNANVGFPGVDAQTLLVLLDTLGVCASAGSSCSSGALEASHVLLAMGLSRADARASVRFTLGFSSTDDDVDHALAVVPGAVDRLRGVGAPA
jgi:cysteine desulfurase